jgi:peptide-methionine (S)-S-oxide reductase
MKTTLLNTYGAVNMKMVCDIPGLNLRIKPNEVPAPISDIAAADDIGEAILAGGCFWCTEAVFRRLTGVQSIEPGYAGGDSTKANYKDVCSGGTGHAEVIRIRYRPDAISYGQLLQIFFAVAHDATQLNRQGNDVGTQYRSAIFPMNEAQLAVAKAYIEQLTQADIFITKIQTSIEPSQTFFPAEQYHYNYAEQNPSQLYIRGVSQPKVHKLEDYFADKLKA